MSDKILPCPFCGCETIRVHKRTCDKDTPYNPADRAYPLVRCYGCGASAEGDDWTDIDTAINRWNRRAPAVPVAGGGDTAYLIRAASEEDASAHFRAEVTEYESTSKLEALEKSHGTDCFINLCQKVGVFTEPDVNDRSVNALRDEGYAVVVFNPDELESADPTDVCDRLIELGWDVIETLSFEEANAST